MLEPVGTRAAEVGVMRRLPAMGAALAFGVGIAAHSVLPLLSWAGLSVALALLWTGIYFLRRTYTSSVLIALALFVLGALVAQVEHYRFPAHHISAFATDTPRLARVELQLNHPPRVMSFGFGQARPLPAKQTMIADVRRVLTWDGWEDATGEVLVQVAQPHPRLATGQTIRVIGLLQRPSPAVNPGQFDWAKYYREQRILSSISIPHAGNIEILEQHPLGPVQYLQAESRKLLAMGFHANRSLDHAILRALLLGDRDPEMRDVQDLFRQTGTSHHLAISGMHVAVLGGVVFGLCRLVLLPPRWSTGVMLGFVIVYGLAALPSPPVVRSILLAACYGVAILGRRSVNFIQLLALSVLIMLIYHPLDLYNAGFQLSFGTVLGLMLFTSILMRYATRHQAPAPLPGAPDAEPPLVRLGRRADHGLLTAFVSGVVAWVVSMPLIAFHFGQLNLWAVLAGILLAPVVFVALVCGMLKVLLTGLWPDLARVWAWCAGEPVRAMVGTVEWLATWPAGDVPLPSPPVWLVLFFFVVLLMNLRPPVWPGLRYAVRAAPGLALGAMFFLPFQTTVVLEAPSRDALRVTLLAVGAGQVAVVEPPSGRVVLIDAGSSSLSDPLRSCVGPFLRSQGRTSIDTIFISHANYDHFSAVAELADAYAAREVLVGPQFREQATGNAPAEGLLRALDTTDRPPRVVAAGDVIPLGRSTTVEILWPTPDSTAPANDVSLVVRLTHAGRTILFTGDIQVTAQKQLLDMPDLLKCDVLVGPHHGSAESTTPAFLSAASPGVIVSSNDRTLTGKQRDFNALAGTIPHLRTHTAGAITIDISGSGEVVVTPFQTGEGKPKPVVLKAK